MRRLSHRGRRGTALLLVLISVVILAGLMAAGFLIVDRAHKATKIELELKGQAEAVAESGITETLSWFRRSAKQPVQAFDAAEWNVSPMPKVSPAGIVREFAVSQAAKLWGRYEVLPTMVSDVTDERGRGDKGSGVVWRVRSTGYVYVLQDPTKPYNVAPNRVSYQVTVETEFQRLAIRPPGRSALLVDRGDSVTVARGGRIRGDEGAAITYRQGTGRPAIDKRAEISSDVGAPMTQGAAKASAITPAYDLSEIEVFGVRPNELATLADVVVSDTSTLTNGLPQLGIVYVDGNADFDEKHPLVGGGVLYVNGNLTIKPHSGASFFGAIYVAGNLDVDAPANLSGSVMVRGTVSMRGTGDVSELGFNEDILNVVQQKLGQYRIRRTMTRVYDANAT